MIETEAAWKVKKVVEANSKAREIMEKIGLSFGNTRESMEKSVNFTIPNLIMSYYNNSWSRELESTRQELKGVDPIANLVSYIKDMLEMFRPALTDEQCEALTAVCESLEYFYEISEELKLGLAVLYVQGYVQVPKE